MIYFIRESDTHKGLIKIGYSNDIPRRIRALQLSNSQPLELMLVVKGDSQAERNLHFHFNHLRCHGEWFLPGEELLDFIYELRLAGLNTTQPASKVKLEIV